MIRVQIDLGDYALGDVLIRPLGNILPSAINKYMFIIVERSTLEGEIIYKKNGIVEVFGSTVSYIDLLHQVLDTSKRNKAIVAFNGYEKSILAIMEAEMV